MAYKRTDRVVVQAFPLYGGLGISAPSLHRESTDSLISSITVESL